MPTTMPRPAMLPSRSYLYNATASPALAQMRSFSTSRSNSSRDRIGNDDDDGGGETSRQRQRQRTTGTSHPQQQQHLTHVDQSGQAHMVSVSGKRITKRSATARGHITTTPHAIELVRANAATKGDVLATARIAGIMAAKQTSTLIPLCHPIALTKVTVDLHIPAESGDRIEVSATAECEGVTGVEMEALTACTAALLTCYDMLKAVDKHMTIGGVRVVRKSGGTSGDWSIDDQ